MPIELRRQADPMSLECPACDTKRLHGGLAPIILPKPTVRERRLAKAGKLDDPWWHIRLAHADKYPNR
ncbi:hypothetical protein [Kitasatospora sp. NPDC059599]|uniref:hypothetical protein n=1 Tax=Kitasatospora sp. NPDC059599 TaxID=3346880 RepID=UPI0036B7C3A0